MPEMAQQFGITELSGFAPSSLRSRRRRAIANYGCADGCDGRRRRIL